MVEYVHPTCGFQFSSFFGSLKIYAFAGQLAFVLFYQLFSWKVIWLLNFRLHKQVSGIIHYFKCQ
ncbi:hypothetical protein HanPSC8_Chr06g0265861 [Helianthus annuus]|nr:hypothetical protein HanPSC8_Chr06g0265861 [Helianthus annuus]